MKTFEHIKWFTVTHDHVVMCCEDENSKETKQAMNIMDTQLYLLTI